MAKDGAYWADRRAQWKRITVEVDPKLDAFLKQWAREEGRGLSNLLRRLVTAIVDKRMAASEIEQHLK